MRVLHFNWKTLLVYTILILMKFNKNCPRCNQNWRFTMWHPLIPANEQKIHDLFSWRKFLPTKVSSFKVPVYTFLFIRISRARLKFFSVNGAMVVYHNKYMYPMKTHRERNTLNTYLRDRASGKSIKIGFKFKNIPFSEEFMIFFI